MDGPVTTPVAAIIPSLQPLKRGMHGATNRAEEVLRFQDASVREVLVRRCSELGTEGAEQVELVHADVVR